jgi:nucleotide sugar dehydrogenase
MSSTILNIKPEEIDTIEKRRNYAICIIGCRQIGILHAYLFAEAGFKIICADADQTRINGIIKGKLPPLKHEIELKLKNLAKTGILNVTTDFKSAVSQSDVIIVTVPVETDEKNKADYSNLESTCKLVGSKLRRGSLVIVMSITGVGVIQRLIKDILENTSGYKAGWDFGLAYNPIQISKGQSLETLTNHERIVAAADRNSLNAALNILGIIAKGNLKKTVDVKAAEAVTLFEAVQQDANIAIANEFATFCEKVGIDYFKVYELAKSNVQAILSLPMLTCENIKGEPYLLMEDSENLNLKLRIPAIAREVNETIIKHAVNLTKDALVSCGKTLRRAKISLLGIVRVPNMKSPPKRTIKEIARMLEAKGAKVSLYDPYFTSNEQNEINRNLKRNLSEALEGADCILILTGHDQFKRINLKKMKMLMKMPAAVIDFEGAVEAEKVEKEGFIFRGFGRGVWTK